jgi:hypothetical protein
MKGYDINKKNDNFRAEIIVEDLFQNYNKE